MPKVLIAPFTLKGSLSALRVGQVLLRLCTDYWHDPRKLIYCPLADGGDDTLSILKAEFQPSGYQSHHLTVTGPFPGQKTQSEFLILPDEKTGQEIAVIEAAQAHGLVKLPPGKTAPLLATSYGVGELIRTACRLFSEKAPDNILDNIMVVTLGGSASSDGGVGALQALGYRFFDRHQALGPGPFSIPDILKIERILPGGTLPCRFLIATDVNNPLCGPHGAARVFSPQKGASPDEVEMIDRALVQLADCFAECSGRDIREIAGAGAAGGLGFGLAQLPNAAIISGFDWLSAQVGLMEKLQQADIILTAEGSFDSQSLHGKGAGRLIALSQGRPVAVFCGQTEPDMALPANVSVFPWVTSGFSKEQAIHQPEQALEKAFLQFMHSFFIHG